MLEPQARARGSKYRLAVGGAAQPPTRVRSTGSGLESWEGKGGEGTRRWEGRLREEWARKCQLGAQGFATRNPWSVWTGCFSPLRHIWLNSSGIKLFRSI